MAFVDDVHNYYEKLVADYIREHLAGSPRDYCADVMCLALNRLPPKYILHDVDMAFFISPKEMEEINNKIAEAVTIARDIIAHARKR